jgi:FMN-dependent oxidoreductase (nitrilotriacetate monooxygenase family)
LASERQLHLGLFVHALGHHVGGWRHPNAQGDATDIDWFTWIAQTAERGTFDMFFVGDALAASVHKLPSTTARLEPLTLLAALAPRTRHIGLAATASTTFGDPFTFARAFSSLDHISHGRIAWNVVTSFSSDAARNFGREDLPSHDERYAVAREFLEVTTKLWDGWEDGALVRDAGTGRFLDDTKIHPAHHKGKYFAVEGPLNISRSPQGRPVLIQAGSSPAGQQLAADTADVVFTAQTTLADAQEFYSGQKRLVAEAGRDPRHLTILPGVMPILGDTREDARRTWNQLNEFVDIDNGLEQLSARFGFDLREYDLDGPVPEVAAVEGGQSRVKLLTDLAAREGLTLRQLAAVAAGSRGHRVVVGTAQDIADDFEEWFSHGGADGFNIMPPYLPDQLDLFVDQVVPELRRRGLFRDSYTGNTLREHLGLP